MGVDRVASYEARRAPHELSGRIVVLLNALTSVEICNQLFYV
jgi:hypothetical protein